MRSRLVSLIIAVAMLASMLLGALPAAADKPLDRDIPGLPAGPHPVDGTYMLGEKEMAYRRMVAQLGPRGLRSTQVQVECTAPEIGDEIVVTVSDMGLNADYDETFVVESVGTHGIILIEKAAYQSYDGANYYFANPNGNDSEPWLRTQDLITPAQLDYLLDEFDNTIYPTDTSIFGMPLDRGSACGMVWVLIHNIRDEAYYDPAAESYVAGYFSSSEDAQNDKNMMHIDSYDWANRTGPDSDRPFLYEGTFAHEFQHLIHFDQDPDEESWLDEGLADLAGYLCGYGHSDSHVVYYLIYHPMVALTFWGGGLEDYGASYLFALYLYEKFGQDFIVDLVQEQTNGIESVEAMLDAAGSPLTFQRLFDSWAIANYLDDPSLPTGMFGYELIDMGSDDTWGWTIEDGLQYYWEIDPFAVPFGVSSDWFYGIEPQPYTAHYHRYGVGGATLLSLDGDDFAGTTAYSGAYEWYSDAEAWAWRSFSQSFDVPAGGASLSFMTFFEIEEDWDYGYVEVHDQATDTWTTLPAAGLTVSTLPQVQENPNCPDGREPSDYLAAGQWNAFTGESGGWIPVEMDLTPFAGHTIELYFVTWQDGAFTLQMMYVDDIAITDSSDAVIFEDDVESGADGWTADGWYITDGILDNGLGANVVRIRDGKFSGMLPFFMQDETQSGKLFAPPTRRGLEAMDVVVVSNRANHILTSHYELTARKLGRWW